MVHARAVHHYDSDPADPSSISIKKGATVGVISTDSTWAVVQTSAGVRGSVPRQILRELPQGEVSVPVSVETVRSAKLRNGVLGREDSPDCGGIPSVQQQQEPPLVQPNTCGLQRPQVDLRHNLISPEGNSASNTHGIQQRLQALQDALKQEVHARAEQSVQMHAAMRRLEDRIDTDCRQPVQDLTKQLDDLSSRWHVQVQERLGKACDDLRTDLEVAMQETHEALQSELVTYKSDFQAKLSKQSALYESHAFSIHELEQRMRTEMQYFFDEHQNKHAEALQSELLTYTSKLQGKIFNQSALHESHASPVHELEQRMRDEMHRVFDEHQRKHADMRDLVNSISDEGYAKHTKVEERLGQISNDMHMNLGKQETLNEKHATAIKDLDKKVGSELEEVRAAMRAELAEYAKSNLQTISTLQSELSTQKGIFEGKLEKHNDLHERYTSSVTALEQRIVQLQQVSSDHHEKHADIKSLIDSIKHDHHATSKQEAVMQDEDLQFFLRDMQAKLQEAQNGLQSEFANHKQRVEGSLGQHCDLHERHALSMQELEQRISSQMQEVSNDHHKQCTELMNNMQSNLQGEMAALKLGSHSDHDGLRNVVMDLMKQVDSIPSSFAQEFGLHAQVEEQVSRVCADMHADFDIAIKDLQETWHTQLADHMKRASDRISGIQNAQAALQSEFAIQQRSLEGKLGEHNGLHESHASSMDELEQRIHKELETQSDSYHEKYASMTSLINCISHEVKHTQAEQACGEHQSSVLNDMWSKLQKEISVLKSDACDAHDSLRDVVTGLTKQMDSLTSPLAVESLLSAGEERLSKHCSDLCSELEMTMREGHVALQAEIADHWNNSSDVISAMQRAHEALRIEVEGRLGKSCDELHSDVEAAMQKDHQALQAQLAEHFNSTSNMVSGMQEVHETLYSELAKCSTRLEQKLGEHNALHEDHALSIKELEQRIRSELQQTSEYYAYIKLQQEDVAALKFRIDDKYGSLQRTMMDFTQHVDRLSSRIMEEQASHIQMEEQFSKACNELRSDFEAAMRNENQALQAQIEEHLHNSSHVVSGMEEVREILRDEFVMNISRLEMILQEQNALHQNHTSSIQDLEQKTSSELQNVFEKHLANSNLQEDVAALRFRVDDNQSSLQSNMTHLTKQMESWRFCLKEESASHIQVEEQLGKVCKELRCDMEAAMQKDHQELQVQLAEHLHNTSNLVSGMQEACETLHSELATSTSHLEQKLGAHYALHEGHVLSMKELEQRIQNELQVISEYNHMHSELQEALGNLKLRVDENHSSSETDKEGFTKQMELLRSSFTEQSAPRVHVEDHVSSLKDLEERMRSELQQISEYQHAQSELQENMAALKSRVDDNHSSLQSNLLDFTEQMESLRSCLTEDSASRIQVEERLAKSCHELHADIEVQLVEHSNNMSSMVSEGQEARKALHCDLEAITSELKQKLGEHDALHDHHASLLKDLEQRLRSELQETSALHHVHSKLAALNEALQSELVTNTSRLEQKLAEHDDLHEGHSSLMQTVRDELKQLADDHCGKQAEMNKLINTLHDEHCAKLAQEEKAREELHGVVNNDLSNLQTELATLKSGADYQHVSVLDVVTDLTRQVDNLTASFAEECALRVQVEERLGSACDDLHAALQKALKEELAINKRNLEEELGAHSALHEGHTSAIQDLENRMCSEFQQASESQGAHQNLQEVQDNLQSELAAHKRSLEDKLGEYHACHEDSGLLMKKSEEKIFYELQEISDEHHRKFSALNDLMNSMKDEHHVTQATVVTDLIMQIDSLKSCFSEESGLVIQMEERLDKACEELRNEVEDAVQKENAAVRVELSEHYKLSGNIVSGMQEAHEALKSELVIYRRSLEEKLIEHRTFHEEVTLLMDKLEQRMLHELQQVSNDHCVKHAYVKDLINSVNEEHHARQLKAEEAWVEGLQSVVKSTSCKLQEEIGGVTDLTKQVDGLTSSFSSLTEESRLCAQVETQLGNARDELRTDLEIAMQQIQGALQAELVEQSMSKQESHAALHNELVSYACNMDGRLNKHDALHEEHAASIHELESRMCKEELGELQTKQAEMKSGQAKKAVPRAPAASEGSFAPEYNLEEKSWAKAMKAFSSAEAMAAKVAHSQSAPTLPTESSHKAVNFPMAYNGLEHLIHKHRH